MIRVYFDKNVLSHLLTSQRGGPEAHGITNSDWKDLFDAVGAGRILNLLGVMHLQEAVYSLRAKSPQVAEEEKRLIHDLMYTEEIIKFPDDLLKDDILSYAQGGGPTHPLMPNTIDLDRLFSDSGDIEERRQALDETTDYNTEFLDETRGANSNDRPIVVADFGGKQPSFKDFYNKRIDRTVSELVERAEQETGQEGLFEICKKRGIGGLVEFKSIAMAAGASLSYQYARLFNEISQNRKAREGDASDLNHALLASAADVFITHDKDFAFWISRVPNTRVEVLDHVHKLISRFKY
jgi:hypothetical protein